MDLLNINNTTPFINLSFMNYIKTNRKSLVVDILFFISQKKHFNTNFIKRKIQQKVFTYISKLKKLNYIENYKLNKEDVSYLKLLSGMNTHNINKSVNYGPTDTLIKILSSRRIRDLLKRICGNRRNIYFRRKQAKQKSIKDAFNFKRHRDQQLSGILIDNISCEDNIMQKLHKKGIKTVNDWVVMDHRNKAIKLKIAFKIIKFINMKVGELLIERFSFSDGDKFL